MNHDYPTTIILKVILTLHLNPSVKVMAEVVRTCVHIAIHVILLCEQRGSILTVFVYSTAQPVVWNLLFCLSLFIYLMYVTHLYAQVDSLNRQGYEFLTISEMMSFPDDKPHR